MPLLKRIPLRNDAVCLIWQMTETVAQLIELLPDAGYADYVNNHFNAERRKLEYLTVRVLLHSELGEGATVAYLASGKPYLLNDKRHISISHTNGFVAVVVSLHEEVGVDIETISTRVTKVTKFFLRKDEPTESLPHVMLHWCAKETIFKLIDLQGVSFVEHMRVMPFQLDASHMEDGCCGCFEAEEMRSPQHLSFLIYYWIEQGYVLTVGFKNHQDAPLHNYL